MDDTNTQEPPCQRNNTITFWINISVLLLIILIFTFYFISFLIYIFTTINKPKPNSKLITYWFEYGIIFTFAIIYILTYFIQQIQYYLLLPLCFHCDERFICIIVYGSGLILMLLCSNNVILDILKGVNLSWTMFKVSQFKPQELSKLTSSFTEIDVMKFIDKAHHIKELSILGVIYLIVLGIYIAIYNGAFMDKIATNQAIKLFFIIYRIFHSVLLLMIVLVFYFLAKGKKRMLENNYHAKNLIIQRIYNSNIANLAYFSDFLTYKAIIDVVGNTPILFFLAYARFKLVPVVIMYICYALYLFFNAVIFLYVDKEQKTEISPFIRRLFCLKRLKFHFGAKELVKLFEDISFDYSEDEEKALKEHYIDTDKSIIALSKQIPSLELSNFSILPNDCVHNEGINYFITFKLLFLFFKKNEHIYTETQKKMEEHANAFKLFTNPKEREQTLKSGADNLLNTITRLSRISKLNEQSLTTSFKYDLDSLMNSLEEKEYKKDFKQSLLLNQDTSISNVSFTIESLFNSLLYELFPFYQLTIKDMLKSLDPGYNKSLFAQFIYSKRKDKNYNNFHTHDSFLYFEIYDHLFLPYDKLKQFFQQYHTYLMTVIKNLNYTYIPIIIGIYHVTYLDFNKIVILYRNPLSFSAFVKFNHWIKYTLTEDQEESAVSQKYNDVIDMNEIEVKNNIILSIDEYEEVRKGLVNDMRFVMDLPFKVYPKIGLFIGNEIHSDMKSNMSQSQINESEGEVYVINKEKNNVGKDGDGGSGKYRDSKLFGSFSGEDFIDGNSVIMKYVQKDYGSEISSLFEKEYEIKGSEGGFIMKIFYLNMFRDKCLVNSNDKHLKGLLDCKEYGE